MDDESLDFKRIKSKEELNRIRQKLHEEWDNIYVPSVRHILIIRKFIRDNGNFVKHKVLVEFVCKRFGIHERNVNRMLDYMVKNDIISDLYWSNETDLVYLINEE